MNINRIYNIIMVKTHKIQGNIYAFIVKNIEKKVASLDKHSKRVETRGDEFTGI